ncbi:MAG: hypothetical protein J6T25_00030 [Bacilli bacterium]|nr:hypothetical protein [Bacilli bacterium]
MFSKSFIISNNDVDKRFKLKISAIFRYFQDIALLATEDLGVDSISLSKRNIDWVITRMSLDVRRLPDCDEEITVHTYPGKDMAMLYPRYFFVTDSKGEVIIRSASIWALIDNISRKVIVDRDVISKLPGESAEDQLPLPEKLSIPEETSFIEKRTIHYSDLDFNSHMNNVRYVELLMDAHDSEFYDSHRLSSLTLNYMKEIKEKEAVDIYTDASYPETIVVKTNGNVAFVGKASFVKE